MTDPIARLRALDPRVVDWTLAAAFVIGGLVEMSFFAEDTADYVGGAVVSLASVSLVVRRRRPIVPAAVIPGAHVVTAFFAPFTVNTLSAGYLALMVAFYSLGRYQTRSWAPVIATGLGLTVIASTISDGFDWGEIFWLGLLGAGPYLIGRAMRNRTRLHAELRARTEEIERDRERRAESAVEDERARLATELQALIANGVSAMVVQAETVPRAIAAGNAPGAERALALVEETGRDALAETRRLLGVLRPAAEDVGSLIPQPTLAQLEGLAERIRGEGLAVEVAFEGEPVALAPGPDLAAYRVVEETLEAAAGDGASSARVAVRFEGDALELDVSDDRAASADAADSLAAMRERFGLYGGRVRADRDANGGFRLLARMPVDGGGS